AEGAPRPAGGVPVPGRRHRGRAERRALLREDPARARRAHGGGSLHLPGLRHRMDADQAAPARAAGRGVREARAARGPDGAARPHAPVPGRAVGVLAAARLAGVARRPTPAVGRQRSRWTGRAACKRNDRTPGIVGALVRWAYTREAPVWRGGLCVLGRTRWR